MADPQTPVVYLADDPGAACIVTGPAYINGYRRYTVRVVNGDKTLSCALTREQMCEMWLFVRREWKATPEELAQAEKAWADA